MEPMEILKKPYARMVVPDTDGTFTAEIVEFPGCIAVGDTAAEALSNLDEVAVDWIAATLEQGQDIPEPMEAAGFSGKLVLRMPKGLHKRATLWAERDGVSLNQFIVTCVAEQVGTRARPMLIYAQPVQAFANFSFRVLGGGIIATPTAIGGYGQPQTPLQFSTSAGQQLISFPMQIRREETHARG
jgi:predicted RNase H-like HicB family nuclease